MKKTINIDFSFEEKHAEGSRRFMPLAGWHANYCEVTISEDEKEKTAMMTFINGKITLIVDGKTSYTFNALDLVHSMLDQERP
jgi:hypothetical protein